MKGRTGIAVAIMFAVVGTCYLCGVIVPEGFTGVRLLLGHATAERIAAGVHFELPGVYSIVQFNGGMYSDRYGDKNDERACAHRMPGPFALVWHIVDARGFYPLSLAAPGKANDEIGRPLLESALCAELKSRPLVHWNSSEGKVLLDAVNQRVYPSGMRLLAIQPRQP